MSNQPQPQPAAQGFAPLGAVVPAAAPAPVQQAAIQPAAIQSAAIQQLAIQAPPAAPVQYWLPPQPFGNGYYGQQPAQQVQPPFMLPGTVQPMNPYFGEAVRQEVAHQFAGLIRFMAGGQDIQPTAAVAPPVLASAGPDVMPADPVVAPVRAAVARVPDPRPRRVARAAALGKIRVLAKGLDRRRRQ